MSSPFTGILPAVVTTLDDEERFTPAPFEHLLDSFYRHGCHGVYVCGQTGEGLLQSAAQRKKVAEVAVRSSPKEKTVIIHVGAQSTHETIDLARHAASIGAAAVASLPPSGRYSFAEVKEFYAVLAAAAGIPLFVYYFPDMYPQVSGFDQLFQLLEISNVAGVKFTNFNLYELSLCASAGKTVFNGHDEVMTAGLLMGARGGMEKHGNAGPTTGTFAFADVVIDAGAHQLLRGGEEFAVEPKAFAVLLEFLSHPGQLLSRDQLLDAVWGHSFVTPATLNRIVDSM